MKSFEILSSIHKKITISIVSQITKNGFKNIISRQKAESQQIAFEKMSKNNNHTISCSTSIIIRKHYRTSETEMIFRFSMRFFSQSLKTPIIKLEEINSSTYICTCYPALSISTSICIM